MVKKLSRQWQRPNDANITIIHKLLSVMEDKNRAG